jgi:hypothetical protein
VPQPRSIAQRTEWNLQETGELSSIGSLFGVGVCSAVIHSQLLSRILCGETRLCYTNQGTIWSSRF